MAYELSYKPDGATLRAFMKDDSFVRGLMGPVGSGKSVACCIELFRRACNQAPGPDGVRRSRMGIVRNTTPQLKTTTVKTWLEWFPEDVFGKLNWTPPYTHRIKLDDVDMEVIFLALDEPKDIRKLLSMEFTAIWINEAREVPKEIVDGCTMRVDRYPSMRDGVGATWAGVIMDTNAPAEDHWWPIMSGDVEPPDHFSADDLLTLQRPKGWTFFKQPPGMVEKRAGNQIVGYEPNPARENRQFVKPEYYTRLIEGKTRAWINVYVLNRYDQIFEGRPVYGDFSRPVHVARAPIPFIPGQPFYVGVDFGLTPAAAIGQKWRGRWLVQRELVRFDMGAERFARELKPFLARELPDDAEIVVIGDPAGDVRVQTDEMTPFSVFRANDIPIRKASTNDPDLRLGAVSRALTSMADGQPGYLLDPSCKMLIAAKEGGYHYKDGKDRPEKNAYSHVSDAEQYMMDGTGDLRKAVRSGKPQEVVVVGSRFNPHKRRPSMGAGFRPRNPVRA